MKKIVLIFGTFLICANMLMGYILSDFTIYNALLSSAAIVLGMIMLTLVSVIQMKAAFRYSLYSLFLILSLIQYISMLFVPAEGFDSDIYIISVLVLLLQILLLLSVNLVSQKNKEIC